MAVRLARGIMLLHEYAGNSTQAARGDTVTYNVRMFLHRGEEASVNGDIIERAPAQATTRMVDGVELIDHVIELGKRCAIAGVEQSLIGMQCAG